MNSPRTVVITGAAGFLGAHLRAACVARGDRVIAVDRNPIADAAHLARVLVSPIEAVDWDALFEGQEVDACFHLAGSASVPASMQDPFGDFSRLIPGTARLMHCLGRRAPRARLVFFSSAAVYGNPARLPVAELDPVGPISPYGVHKHVAEQLIFGAASCFGLSTVSLRIFSAFGEGLRKQLFFDLDRKARAALDAGNDTLELYGTGRESRDFIHGADVARAALLCAEAAPEAHFQVINLARGVETTIAEAAVAYLRAAELPVRVCFNGQVRPGDPLNWCADVQRLRRLGFVPEVDLASGLARYARWLRETHG